MSWDHKAVKASPVLPKTRVKTTRRALDLPAKPQRKIEARAAPPAVMKMMSRVGSLSDK
jgi:hypothetical protein